VRCLVPPGKQVFEQADHDVHMPQNKVVVGHAFDAPVLQTLDSEVTPLGQPAPKRTLPWVPPPQVFEQLDHAVHELQGKVVVDVDVVDVDVVDVVDVTDVPHPCVLQICDSTWQWQFPHVPEFVV